MKLPRLCCHFSVVGWELVQTFGTARSLHWGAVVDGDALGELVILCANNICTINLGRGIEITQTCMLECHLSTSQARPCSASEIWREWVRQHHLGQGPVKIWCSLWNLIHFPGVHQRAPCFLLLWSEYNLFIRLDSYFTDKIRNVSCSYSNLLHKLISVTKMDHPVLPRQRQSGESTWALEQN